MITQLLTPTHVALLVVALLLIFGPRRLPETGRALGRGLHEFREGIAGRGTPERRAPTDVAPGTETDSHRLHD